jgi:OOP family OmpA-OmpF porin
LLPQRSIWLYRIKQDSPWWLTIECTNNKRDYKFYDGCFTFGQFDDLRFSVGVERYLKSSFDLELGFSLSIIVYNDIFDSKVTDLDLRGVNKFDSGYIFKKWSKVAPHVFTAYGVTSFFKILPHTRSLMKVPIACCQ